MTNPDAEIYLVNDYDNHNIHAREHNHFRKKIEYQRLKTDNPEIFMAIEVRFNEHLAAHQAFIDEEIKRMIEQQQAMNEKGGDTGGKKE